MVCEGIPRLGYDCDPGIRFVIQGGEGFACVLDHLAEAVPEPGFVTVVELVFQANSGAP